MRAVVGGQGVGAFGFGQGGEEILIKRGMKGAQAGAKGPVKLGPGAQKDGAQDQTADAVRMRFGIGQGKGRPP